MATRWNCKAGMGLNNSKLPQQYSPHLRAMHLANNLDWEPKFIRRTHKHKASHKELAELKNVWSEKRLPKAHDYITK